MNETIEKRTNRSEDEAIESAVLHQLLDLHPARLTLEELNRELGVGREGYADRDALERAVRDLAASGLLYRESEFVEPTRAAVRCSELMDR